MTYWWNWGSSHTSPTTETSGAQFSDPAAQNLIGLWDFSTGATTADTGLADGIAQNGHFVGDATASGNALRLNGNGHFDTAGTAANDVPFEIGQGTVMLQFNQDNHVGTSPDTLVSRGEYADRSTEGHFNISVTEHGAVTVFHASGEQLSLSTGNGFFSAGDDVRVAYSWDESGTGSFVVENITDGTSYSEDFDSTGLSMDIGDNDDENFTFGAREKDDGVYDHYFDGQIGYVAIFNTDVVNVGGGEGIVEGTDGDDLIDTAYTGDPDGDMIDAGDALLEGEVGDDDIVVAGAGNDTVLSGEGDDEVYGQAGDDYIDGGAGNDFLVGDGGTGSTRVPTGETVRESFEWDLAGVSDEGQLNGFTQDTGNVDVTFSYSTTGATQTEFSTDTQKVHSIDTDGSGADAHSSMDSELSSVSDKGTYELGFSDPVSDVSFRVNDIDGDGVVKVTAFDADGNQINVDMTGGYKLTLLDTDGQFGVDTADSKGGYEDDTSGNYSILVDIPGPVARVVIEHTQDGANTSGINVTDVYYDATVYEVIEGSAGGEVGDDTILGGAGDDIIYGDTGQGATAVAGDPTTFDISDMSGGKIVSEDGVVTTDVSLNGFIKTTSSSTYGKATPDNVFYSGPEVGGSSNTLDLEFDTLVSDVSFTIYDVNQGSGWDDKVTIIALDADGNQVPVTFSGGNVTSGGVDVSGNSIDGNDNNTTFRLDPNNPDNVQVTISGPIASLEIIHEAGNDTSTQLGWIGVGDIEATPILDPNSGAGTGGSNGFGDDILMGGTGDDVIYGDNGDNLGITGDETSGTDATGIDLAIGNVRTGSDTGDSIIYDDVATLDDGTSISARLVLVETSDSSLNVDLTPVAGSSNGHAILLNGNNDAGSNGDTATFRLEFFDPATGEPVAINSGLSIGDIDLRNAGEVAEFDLDDITGYGTRPGSSLTVQNDGTSVSATGTETNNADDPDAEFGVTFENTSEITFTVTAGATNTGFVFGDFNADDFNITPVDRAPNDEGGNDIILGDEGDDTLYGEGGNDTITGGDGADSIYGGSGADTIIGGNAGDVVDGGTTGDDNDTLDLSNSGPLRIVDETTDEDGDSTSGTVEFLDNEGNVTGTMSFTEIENLILPENTGPVANDDTATVLEDGSVVIDVLDNDTDANGDALTIASATVPADQGTVEIVDGKLVFTPAENYNGPAEITYTVDDGNGGTDTGTVNVDVTPVNDAPDAVNDEITTDEDTAVTIDVLDNDTDVDGDTLTITGATVPAEQGTVEIVDNELVFTPADDFNGEATISYAIEDGNGGTDTATVTVNVTPVNDDPVAVDDAFETDEDTAVVIDLIGNDTDVDGDPLTIGTVSVDPAFGEVVDNGDGTATFTPAENYYGPVTIDYTVVDGNGGEDAGQAIVNVGSVNDGPTANDDEDTTDEDVSITVDLIGNDTDPDGDTLTVTGASVPADQGTLVDNGDGTVTFTPAENFNGEATISYSVTDGNGGTSSATHTVNVTPVNDDPVAVDDIETTDEDQSVVIDLIGNDTDVDGDPLTIGTVSVDPALGEVVDNGDGTVTFTPAPDYNGPVTIDYTVVDGQGGEDAGQAIVSVGAVNDAPEANDDADTTDEDTSITVDLLGNDTDPDGDTLEVINATVPADQGTLVDNGDGTVTFTPAANFNGEATISYEISDGNGGTDTGVHTINVTPVEDAPITEDDTATTDEDTAVTIDVLDNDTDPDGQPLTIGSATVPADQGTVEIVDGKLVFTPADDFNGEATITYTAKDPDGNETPGTAVVNVTPVNDDPVAVDDTATVPFEGEVTIDVLDNDTDVDGDTLTIASATVPVDQGTVEIVGNELVFTAADGFEGEATITYTVSDGNGGTDEGEVLVTVEASPLDGIVSGTAGDDIIDLAYTDDPEGDMVDNNDEIIAGEGPNDDIIRAGAGDDIVYGGLGDDDIVDEEGSDTVYGEDGNDYIDVSGPNSGPNTFDELAADPSLLGDAALDDTPLPDGLPYDALEDTDPNNDIDFVDGGDGDDTIITGDDDDTIYGGLGNDTIYAGIDNDTVYGGAGNDTIIDVQGADYIEGGAGDDYIDAGNNTFSDYVGDDPNLPNGLYPFPNDQNTEDGKDEVHGGSGNDTIFTGDDADIVYGDQGDDIIDAGIDDDEVYGGSGNDTITGGHGSDRIFGGSGDDIIYAGDVDGVMNHTNEGDETDPVPENDMDYVRGGGGNDTIYGGDDADTLYGDAGDDYIDGGLDDDFISGGDGTDILIGGHGNDTLVSDNDDFVDTLDAGEGDDTLFVGTNDIADAGTGDDTATIRGENATVDMGDGDDFVTVTNGADGADIMGGAGRDTFDINNAPGTVANPSFMTIDGGSAGDDYDVLDLTGSTVEDGSFDIEFTNPDSNGNGFDGTVTYYDASGNMTGTLEFTEIENVIPCFTPGTMIATPKGEVDVATMKVGDKVITRDNGLQSIRWIGKKSLSPAELMLRPELRPVMISQGALGNGLPERDMMVSPNHRMLVSSDKAALYFDDHEVLVAAKHLTKMDGVELVDATSVTYIHVMFDHHEVILSDGTWSESFQPGDFTLAGIGEEQREEIFALFPELREQSGRGHYATARRVLRKHEAELLVS
ncbi:Ca2+-binding RTX toxin-like protein [Pacificibacter maritimus]|uniref:Ca2+-binding RTX toxin-like protein n=1 Tax=Pacificibacter maritimus TaxID=762213 RepID=A0A3N4UM22_9RHOB|nr:cadherin-like domain-containing protein [Pacificibacter maritimus]RPE71493.1 Ca2+-binding RTX toxin-like protein [Pacificibacter maritimus]